MKFLRKTTWQEVYEDWRKNETKDDLWRAHYNRRGFETWEDFRKQHIDKEDLTALDWELYEVDSEEIPSFHCGDFENWQKLSKELGDDTFATLSQAPYFQKDHTKIQDLLANFPPQTQMIALKKGDQIYLFEGHHRAVAISQLCKSGKTPDVQIKIAIAEVA